jgi:GntR family transcriptional regulator
MARAGATKQALVRIELLTMLERLAVGDSIPPERRLAVELGVSRPTLRAAIDDLAREGLLERRHGSGTYVTTPKIALPLTMTSFSEDMARRGMHATSRVLGFESISAGAKLGTRLQVSPMDRVYAIRRLRLADGETMAIEVLHVPEQRVPGLRAHDLEGSFYGLLRERFGIVVASAVQTIEPTVTSEDEASVLGVPVHSPAFLFERVTESEEGDVVEYVRSVYRGDRYKLVAELRRPLR